MLRVENISKSFENKKVVKDVLFSVAKGERVAILGPSGCGKSTLLNCICGIVTPDEGIVFWDEENLNSVSTHQRNFGLMFQEYALFPHMNVAENICFGLEMLDFSKEAKQARLQEMLSLVGLEGFEDRLVQQLSGGERQRVALARSLAPAPKLLLLDEPLGALDRTLRENLLVELQTILKNQTVILVTHDQAEAFQIAETVYIMNQGKIVQEGAPIALLEHPNSVFVAEFLGYENIFEGVLSKGNKTIQTLLGEINLFDSDVEEFDDKEQISVLLKSHHLTLYEPKEFSNELFFGSGSIVSIDFHGKMMRLKIAVNDYFVFVEEPLHLNHFSVGDFVSIWMLDRKAFVLFHGNN